MVSKIREKYFLSRSVFIQTINQVFHSSQLPSHAFPHHLLQNFSTLSASYLCPNSCFIPVPESFSLFTLTYIFTITSVYCQKWKLHGAGDFFVVVNFWLCWVFIAVPEVSLVEANGGYSLVKVGRLLVAVASLVLEHGLWAHGLQ